jgi:hypothetical protein
MLIGEGTSSGIDGAGSSTVGSSSLVANALARMRFVSSGLSVSVFSISRSQSFCAVLRRGRGCAARNQRIGAEEVEGIRDSR